MKTKCSQKGLVAVTRAMATRVVNNFHFRHKNNDKTQSPRDNSWTDNNNNNNDNNSNNNIREEQELVAGNANADEVKLKTIKSEPGCSHVYLCVTISHSKFQLCVCVCVCCVYSFNQTAARVYFCAFLRCGSVPFGGYKTDDDGHCCGPSSGTGNAISWVRGSGHGTRESMLEAR